MQAPVPPRLSDFGLTDADMAALPKAGKVPAAIGIAVGLWVFLHYITPALSKATFGQAVVLIGLYGLWLVPLSAAAGGICFAAAMSVEDSILRRTSGRFRRASDFRTAIQSYEKRKRVFEEWKRKCQEDYWRSLSGTEFERELGKLFSAMGFHVEMTPTTGDGGVDLMLRRGGRLTVVQCKAHAKKIPIGVARELVASMADFEADDAIIACLEGVTKPVMAYIRDKPINVVTVTQIVDMQGKLG